MNEINSTNEIEIKGFIKLIQQLNPQEQAGILQIIQGAKLICQNKKQVVIFKVCFIDSTILSPTTA